MMCKKTYTLEIDGVPKYVVRAKDQAEAIARMMDRASENISIRPSTLREREAWTRQSVDFGDMGILGSDQPEWPDSFIADLEDDEPGQRFVPADED
jgi:hypothetical protein